MNNQEQLLAPRAITLFGRAVDGVTLEADTLGRELKAYLERNAVSPLRSR